MKENKKEKSGSHILGKLLLTALILFVSFFAGLYIFIISMEMGLHVVFTWINPFIMPVILIPLVLCKNKKKILKIQGILLAVYLMAVLINIVVHAYNESITIDTSPNTDVNLYLPFQEESKIVKLDEEASLQLRGDLPVVDGAAAVFPVYSAFVNATYPDTVELYDGTFEYNNTVGGYMLLAEKQTDIFFGAYPSEEQIAYAKERGTEFVYTPIGSEAFVFFVHKDNPVDSLTVEQIQGIYSGEIKNWKEVGGADEKIVAFQRNEGSGSQSMLVRFMDGKPIMKAPSEQVNDLMSGIIERVSDYKSTTASIGFSFRYYVEGIIQNPNIKMISIDGVAPTVENIKNESYPVVGPLYAVTYKGNENENVDLLLEWVLSDQGQEIIEKTGYAGILK
ncbi:MAG: substrate-binding domain-containing protein [Lachnospiraceae bacterium]|nr:substrate-binding domain-containing protein [Lachnospiraceae bacterium]